MFEKFAESARIAVFFARYEALTSGRPDIRLSDFEIAIRYLFPEMPNSGKIESPFLPRTTSAARSDLPLSEASRRVLRNSAAHAQALWKSDPGRRAVPQWFSYGEEWFVDPRHVLLALAQERGEAIEKLKAQLFTTDAASPVVSMPAEAREVLGKHTQKLGAALLCAVYESNRFACGVLGLEHLLLGLVFGREYPVASETRRRPDLGSITALRQRISTAPNRGGGKYGTVGAEALQALRYAVEENANFGHQAVGTAHLLLGLLRMEDCWPVQYLNGLGLDLPGARAATVAADLLR